MSTQDRTLAFRIALLAAFVIFVLAGHGVWTFALLPIFIVAEKL